MKLSSFCLQNVLYVYKKVSVPVALVSYFVGSVRFAVKEKSFIRNLMDMYFIYNQYILLP